MKTLAGERERAGEEGIGLTGVYGLRFGWHLVTERMCQLRHREGARIRARLCPGPPSEGICCRGQSVSLEAEVQGDRSSHAPSQALSLTKAGGCSNSPAVPEPVVFPGGLSWWSFLGRGQELEAEAERAEVAGGDVCVWEGGGLGAPGRGAPGQGGQAQKHPQWRHVL